MSEEKRKIPRLAKAAGELNVSVGTAVELLNKKNFDIDASNPNAKLTEEMYDTLLQAFAKDKSSKEEADKIDIGSFGSKVKSETKSKTSTPEEPEKQEVDDTLLIKTNQLPDTPLHPKNEITGPTIIGKIDLDELKSSNKPAQKEVEPIVENTPTPEPEPEPKPESEPKSESVVEPTPQKPEPEMIETKAPSLKPPKVLDQIDLDNLKHPHKKEEPTQPVEVQPTEAVQPEPKEEVATPTVETAEPEPEIIKTDVKIQGPKVVGKIELPVDKPKENPKKNIERNNNSNKKDNNKKRKRIIKQQPHDSKVRTNNGNNGNSGNNGNNRNNQQQKQEPKEPVEITAEDIQRRIKETKMRLDPTGKSKAAKRRKEKRQMIHERIEEQELLELENQKILKVTEFITADELATMMNKPVTKIIATCMSIGLMISINQRLDAETIKLLAEEFGFEVDFIDADAEEEITDQEIDNPEDLVPRHPIITVMGHVDHGKTSLLDYIRKTNVIAGEAGGITQHIGAYEVTLSDGRKITFLDTPGHEAFTAMRARGARITDLCIIVVAADDAVMPQTIEAINHAQAAGVPMVFAITKIDKPNADVDRIKSELANMNILVEDWGGKYQCQEIDAKHGTNVMELLEKVLIEAEMLDLKANPNRLGVGTVIESSLDKGRGYIAKVLVQNGTLSIGDPIVAGSCYGKVKAMFNERNQAIKSAGPATPVLLLGLNGAPQAGDTFKVCETEQESRGIATKRARLAREMGLRTQKHITLEEIGRRIAIGDFKELNIIVKGDVDGSVEALSGELLKLSTEQVQVNVIHKSVGAVTESDVLLATASNALIVAFQVRPTAGARKTAESEQIDIRTYSIIYTAINEIKDAIAGMHAPEIREKIVANIEIREVFHISKVGNIAGCMVLDGKLQRSSKIRLIRDGIVIYTGKLGSLRRFKDDVKEVVAGQDCGMNIDGCNDIKVGDIIEGYEEYEVAYNANK